MAEKKYLSSQGLGKYHNKLIDQMAQDDNAVLNSSKSYTDTEISGFASEVNTAIDVVAETLDEHKELIDGKANFYYTIVTLYADMWSNKYVGSTEAIQFVPVSGITNNPEQVIIVYPISNDIACDYISCTEQGNGKLRFEANCGKGNFKGNLEFGVMYTSVADFNNSSSDLLNFTIDKYNGNQVSQSYNYECPRRYTWGDFINSIYNVDNFTYNSSEQKVTFGDYEIYDRYNEMYPKIDTKILFGAYSFESSSGPSAPV